MLNKMQFISGRYIVSSNTVEVIKASPLLQGQMFNKEKRKLLASELMFKIQGIRSRKLHKSFIILPK